MKTILCSIIFLFMLPFEAIFAHEKHDVSIDTTMVLQTPTGKIFGSLNVPENFDKGKLVIFISGSGPTDRDGNNPLILGKNNCFLQLAQVLSKHGIASFRFDKRGIGESAKALKKEADLRFEDYVNDVEAWIGEFKRDKRFTEITIAGHSEGSLIGMLAARGRADKYISIAGPGDAIGVILKKQLAEQLPDAMETEVFADIDSLAAGFEVKKFRLELMSVFRPSVQPYIISWMKYNPQIEIAKLEIPVLIIQGDNDIQVGVEDAQKLYQAKPDASYKIIKKMNHVLKNVPVSNRNEHIKTYGDSTLPVSSKMVKEILRFIKK